MVRIWDAPTRVFHWSLAAAFAGEWLTRDARYLDVHEFLGYAIGVLVAFRLFWGFAGTRWARFASFPPSAANAARYLRGLARREPERHVGHNPAGSWAIYILLALAAAQVATGVVTLGAEKRAGPLAGVFGYRVGDVAHEVHEWLAWAMLGVVAVHIAGVLVGSLLERENLVGSMLSGFKHAAAADAVAARRGVAIALAGAIALGAIAWFRAFPADAQAYRRGALATLPMEKTWIDECGGCHVAYHPSLLPRRSWARLFPQQHEHFGEDLDLGAGKTAQLQAFAERNAAEAIASPVAWKMATTIPAASVPLRITDTPYWKQRHARLDDATWKRIHPSDCGSCHLDADAGLFSPLAIRVASGANAPKRQKGS